MSGRVERTVWAGVFVALLVSSLVMGLANLRPFAVSTGAPAATPELEPGRAFDAEYYQGIDSYLVDRLAGRGLGARARYLVDYELFGDSTSDLVDVGSNDTLFYAPYQVPPCETVADFSGFIDPKPSDVDVRYTVIAPKSAFYPNRLADRNKPSACLAAARGELTDLLAADPLAIPIDAALAETADTGTEVFFQSDTHWSPEARLIVAEQVVESFAPGLWDDSAVSIGEVERLGDLRRLLGSSEPRSTTGPVVDRGPVTDIDIEELSTLRQLLSRHTESDADAVVPGTTLIIGDSQMGLVLPLIDRYFEDLRFINWITLDLRPSTVVPDADRVLFESIEIEATQRFSSPSMAKVRDTLGV